MVSKTSQNPQPSPTARGKKAEDLAASFLAKKGYTLLERGFRWKRGELDIIALTPSGVLVFAEVRSSSGKSQGGSLWLRASVDWKKRMHLIQSAQVFLLRRPRLRSLPSRFDLLWVEEGEVEHWEHVGLG